MGDLGGSGTGVTPGIIEDPLKRWTIRVVAVMDQILPRRKKSPRVHRHVTGRLHHPYGIGMRRDASDMDLSTA